jgi:hypothetical protein
MFGVISRRLAGWSARCLALIAAPIVLGLAQGAAAQTPPIPPVAVPFDVVAAGSTAEIAIRVSEKRPYQLDLNLYYAGQQDLSKVRQMAGDAARFPDGRYSEPGTPVVIRVTVDDEGGSTASPVHYDKTTITQGHYLHGFAGGGAGHFARSIGAVVLGPGRYRVRAEVIAGAPELRGIETRLSVTYDPRAAALKE